MATILKNGRHLKKSLFDTQKNCSEHKNVQLSQILCFSLTLLQYKNWIASIVQNHHSPTECSPYRWIRGRCRIHSHLIEYLHGKGYKNMFYSIGPQTLLPKGYQLPQAWLTWHFQATLIFQMPTGLVFMEKPPKNDTLCEREHVIFQSKVMCIVLVSLQQLLNKRTCKSFLRVNFY